MARNTSPHRSLCYCIMFLDGICASERKDSLFTVRRIPVCPYPSIDAARGCGHCWKSRFIRGLGVPGPQFKPRSCYTNTQRSSTFFAEKRSRIGPLFDELFCITGCEPSAAFPVKLKATCSSSESTSGCSILAPSLLPSRALRL